MLKLENMAITVKFFAKLREDLGMDVHLIEHSAICTVKDVWKQATGDKPMPSNTLMAVNMQYVNADHEVRPDDEVAFFPPVTGG